MNDISSQISDAVSLQFNYYRKNLEENSHIELKALTGALRVDNNKYTLWGKIITESGDPSRFKNRYQEILKFREKNYAEFATLLFSDNRNKSLPFIIFKYSKINNIDSKYTGLVINHNTDLNYIEIDYSNLPEILKFPFKNPDNKNYNFEIYNHFINNINEIFNKYNSHLDLSNENLIGFFNLTSPIVNDVNYLIYLPFVPIHNYANGVVFLYAKGEQGKSLDYSQLDKISWIIYGPLMKFYLKELIDFQIKHATKSAIAAIMARNMSHNLGSHVLSYASVNLNHPFDIQVLLEYLQERMDFIAQITAEPPQWSMPMHFVGQLMRNLYKQRILLNYIVASEGLKAKEFNKDSDNKDELQIIILKKKDNEWVEIDNLENDPVVVIPGGITGAHAFYTILENVIRNAAKHSYNKRSEEGLKIFVWIDDTDDKKVTVQIYDNVSNNIKKDDKSLFERIENPLKQSIIKDDGSLKYENWGISEIKIGAGFLQKEDQTKIGSNLEELDFIKVIALDENGTEIDEEDRINQDIELFIGYKFSIPKPRYVLIIDKDATAETSKDGVWIKNDIKENMSFDYDFVVIKDIGKEKFDKIKDQLPARVFALKNILSKKDKKIFVVLRIEDIKDIIKLTNNHKYNEIRKFLFKLWIKKLLGNKKLKAKTICLEVSPHEKNSGGSSVSDVKAYKYAIESLLKSYNDDNQKDLIEFLNQNNPDIAELYRKIIRNKKLITELISKKSTVVNFFKKYEEHIETLPDRFKESSEKYQKENQEKKEEKNKSYKKYFNGTEIIDECPDNTTPLNIKYKRHASAKTEEEYYVEALSGSQSYFTEIENFVKNGGEDNIFVYSLMETGLLDITVVDERVFEFYNSNPEIGKRFDSVNIFVTDNLEALNKTIEIEKAILIIHQGILDKTVNVNIEKINENFKYIYITSGSGDKKKNDDEKSTSSQETSIKLQAKFIPFSNVRSALMRQYPEKYILIQSLMKIRYYHGKVFIHM